MKIYIIKPGAQNKTYVTLAMGDVDEEAEIAARLEIAEKIKDNPDEILEKDF